MGMEYRSNMSRREKENWVRNYMDGFNALDGKPPIEKCCLDDLFDLMDGKISMETYIERMKNCPLEVNVQ